MFPRTFGSVLAIVGGIWVVQGLGLIPTGSFMDGQPVWAAIGAPMVVVGLISVLAKRRGRDRSDSER
ncbi:MAG: hypothetical protein ACT4OM_11550 [Actinomycetota bacterium]